MSKLSKKVIGVDVGAKFLTVSFTDNVNQDQVFNIQNNQRSILSFLKKFPTEDYCLVIEATGNYSSRILHLSLDNGFESSLINCMSVKYFSRMKISSAKLMQKTPKSSDFMERFFVRKFIFPKASRLNILTKK